VSRRALRVSRAACSIVPALALTGAPLTPLPAQDRGAAALAEAIEGLGVNMRVLMIGAHPDDEDTQVISWLSRGHHVETAYLSLTRGDGGQNIIGNELGEALGVVRTEELLAARRVDGGRQFFTRAYDYGYSKSAEEAFTQWAHDSLLRDVVTVVRAFRPHVIISVFSGTTRDGHGQHQAAGILAREAYDFSGDTTRFPRSATAGQGAWTVAKFYRGGSFRQQAASLRFNVGTYDPVIGRSYAEIAAISRSQHRSQAFGTLQPLGVRMDGITREASRVPAPEDAASEASMFDGIDTTWARFRGALRSRMAEQALDSLPGALEAARAAFNVFSPVGVLPALIRVSAIGTRLCAPVLTGETGPCGAQTGASPNGVGQAGADLTTGLLLLLQRVDAAIAMAAGVAVEATAPRELWATPEPVQARVTVYNRGVKPVRVLRARVTVGGGWAPAGQPPATVAVDSTWTHEFQADGSRLTFGRVTQPRWLVRPRQGAMLDYAIGGAAEATHALDARAHVELEVDGARFSVTEPVVYRYADQVRGEVRRPIAGVPAISVRLDQEVEYAPARRPIEREVRVHLRGTGAAERNLQLAISLPAGLNADSASRSVSIPANGVVRTVAFQVRGTLPAGRHVIDVVASEGGETYAQGYTTIDYEHINPRRMYRPSRLTIEAVDVAATGPMRVGYIQGVGDNSAAALSQLGVDVTLVDPASLAQADLSGYHAIVVGPRAYDANPALVANNARLLEYVRTGGTMVVQYGQYEMMRPGMTPYPLTINRPHDRVTNENAPVTLIDSTSTVLRSPNVITPADFEGWIQDRSLYMPRTFDPAYVPSVAMSDPGEPPNRGGILVAPYGRGTYVYTSLAFFRQLPNGVPGAARLFLNLLAARTQRPAQ
jgi:LmbE family N-acetylglucosaminyl deacetylase